MLKQLLTILLIFPLAAYSLEKDFTCTREFQEKDVLKKVSDSYKSVQTLTARFEQESSFLGFNEKNQSSGEVFFEKPGKMDWQYIAPDPQRFVSDGETLWFFQPDLDQVTLADFKNSFQSDLPVSFLLGLGDLENSFELKKSCYAESHILLELEPKSEDSSMQKFHLLLSAEDYLPRGAKILDAASNQTSILLKSLVTNADFSKISFNFKIPRGVDIIDQRVLN